jgi:hypothetical protein
MESEGHKQAKEREAFRVAEFKKHLTGERRKYE